MSSSLAKNIFKKNKNNDLMVKCTRRETNNYSSKKKSFTNILILKWYERVSESNNDKPVERD